MFCKILLSSFIIIFSAVTQLPVHACQRQEKNLQDLSVHELCALVRASGKENEKLAKNLRITEERAEQCKKQLQETRERLSRTESEKWIWNWPWQRIITTHVLAGAAGAVAVSLLMTSRANHRAAARPPVFINQWAQ